MEIAEDVGVQGSPTYAYVYIVRDMVAHVSMFVKHKFGKFVLDSLPPEGIRISRMPQRKGRPPPPVPWKRGLPCTRAWRGAALGSGAANALRQSSPAFRARKHQNPRAASAAREHIATRMLPVGGDAF